MEIQIQRRDGHLTDGLRSYIKQQLGTALGRFSDRIQKVAVTLSDLNGPKRGVDQHCKVQVVMPPLPPVIIEDTESNLRAAVAHASHRAAINVDRRIGKGCRVSKERGEW